MIPSDDTLIGDRVNYAIDGGWPRSHAGRPAGVLVGFDVDGDRAAVLLDRPAGAYPTWFDLSLLDLA